MSGSILDVSGESFSFSVRIGNHLHLVCELGNVFFWCECWRTLSFGMEVGKCLLLV